MTAFEIIDEKSDDYYKEWKKIRKIIDSKIEKPENQDLILPEDYFDFIPGLIQIARNERYETFSQFCEILTKNWKNIKRITDVIRLSNRYPRELLENTSK